MFFKMKNRECHLTILFLITLLIWALYFQRNSVFENYCPCGDEIKEPFCQCSGECPRNCNCGQRYPLNTMYTKSNGYQVPTTNNLYEPYYMI